MTQRKPSQVFNDIASLLLTEHLGPEDTENLVKLLDEYNEALEANGLPRINWVGEYGQIISIEEAKRKIREGDERIIKLFRDIVMAYAEAEDYL